MKKRIYFTIIAAIAVFGAGLVAVNNTTNSLAQSSEKVSASTEMVEGLTVTRIEGSIIAPTQNLSLSLVMRGVKVRTGCNTVRLMFFDGNSSS
ncbi:hypothetical protein [Nostoc sp.]|uniref:hypothetical protein n=1 Tax=Nostoc sp. TaxID=1180 RepID=UPI0035947F9E